MALKKNSSTEVSEEILEKTELEEPEAVKHEEEEAELAEAEEEEEKKRKIKKIKKPEPVGEEYFFTIPLRRVSITRNIRTPKAVKLVKNYINRHLKPEDVKIDEAINELVWKRGIEKPPAKIHVRVIKDKDGVATVYPVKEK